MSHLKAESYYLSKDVPKFIRNLSELKSEWERGVASLLLDRSIPEEEKAEKIGNLLPNSKSDDTSPSEVIETVLQLLPKATRGRARIFLTHLLPRVSLADGDIVSIPDFGPTSPLIDVVKYFCSPPSHRVPPPFGMAELWNFFQSRSFPQSAFCQWFFDR